MFEDGNQSRDFIHVSDIARAFHPRELVGWIQAGEASVNDRTEAARGELEQHGLVL